MDISSPIYFEFLDSFNLNLETIMECLESLFLNSYESNACYLENLLFSRKSNPLFGKVVN